MARVHVTSEIGPLRAVLVHTPGRELVAVTPGNREDYLYDDIIDLELAEREHRRFVAVLERFAQVYEVRTLLTELVARPDVRGFLVTPPLEVVPSDALATQRARPVPRLSGFGQRAAPAAPVPLGALLLEPGGGKDGIVVVPPTGRTAFPLDSFSPQPARGLCSFYPPHFVGREPLPALHRRKKSK